MRRGVGMLLIIILILVTVMSFIAMARSVFSKSVTSQVLRSSLGIQAQTLAESAAEEALVELRSRVNDPSDELFNEFRKEVFAGQKSALALDIQTPQFDALYDRFGEMSPFYLEERSVAVNFQRQFTSMPYERFGLAQIRTAVRRDVSLTTSVKRAVELGVEFKVHLLSAPRPFDQTAVYVQDGTRLLRNAYQRLEDILQSIEFRRSEHEDIADLMEQRKDSVPFNGRAMLTRYTHGVSIPDQEYWREKLPPLRTPAALFASGRKPDGISLEHLNISENIRLAAEDVTRAEEELEAARSKLEANFDRSDLHNAYLNRLRITLGTYSEAVGRMDKFRRMFHVWDGDKYPELGKFSYKLTKQEWARKASFVLDRDPAGAPPQKVLDQQLSKSGGAYGVYYSDWKQMSLHLQNRRIKGRVVLVAVDTAVSLSNIGPAGPDDLLTIVSFGSLRLSGKIQASILALGSVSVDPGTELEGTLVFNKVPNPRALTGKVYYDPRNASGITKADDVSQAKTQYYWVSVAPRPVYKAIERGNR